MMLVFLAPADINEQFNLIEAGAIEMAQPILSYFRNFWLKTVGPEGFFCHILAKRTNNGSEPINSSFLRMLRPHPDFWDWVSKMREASNIHLAELNAGRPIRRMHGARNLAKSARLLAITRRYDARIITATAALSMFAGIMPSIVNEAAALEDARSDDQDIDLVQEIV